MIAHILLLQLQLHCTTTVTTTDRYIYVTLTQHLSLLASSIALYLTIVVFCDTHCVYWTTSPRLACLAAAALYSFMTLWIGYNFHINNNY